MSLQNPCVASDACTKIKQTVTKFGRVLVGTDLLNVQFDETHHIISQNLNHVLLCLIQVLRAKLNF